MYRRFAALAFVPSILAFAAPALAQVTQFRANITQTGDTPFEGMMYLGNRRMRFEGVSDGEQVAMILDAEAGTMTMLMPEDRMYMTMDIGSAPFSAPGASPMDPTNPCSTGEVSECRSLGNQTINGYAASGWEYTRDGDRETSWIANQLRFPVRTIDADGATTELTNVQMGAQPASLFEPPSDYTAMDIPGFGGFGGRGGRGEPAAGRGRGQVPSGAAGRGAPTAAPGAAPAGVDPAAAAQLEAQLRAMGLPPDQIAMSLAQLGAAAATQGIDYSAWEAGDGWLVELVATASHSDAGSYNDGVGLRTGTWSSTYSARFTASVPFTYGTPGAAGMGPAWQLLPGAGSPRGEAEPIRFSGTSEYRREDTQPQNCEVTGDGVRRVTVARATGSTNTTDAGPRLGAQARWALSGDLTTHQFQAAAAATEPTETVEVTTTITARCPDSDSEDTREESTRRSQMGILVNLTDLPLPASPQTMQGTATVPMTFYVDGVPVEIDANVEWTLRPIQ